jgi:hypothetical protein
MAEQRECQYLPEKGWYVGGNVDASPVDGGVSPPPPTIVRRQARTTQESCYHRSGSPSLGVRGASGVGSILGRHLGKECSLSI